MTENDDGTLSGVLSLSDFLAFLEVIMQIFIRPNERARKCFGFITETYFIFADLCIYFLDGSCTGDALMIPSDIITSATTI